MKGGANIKLELDYKVLELERRQEIVKEFCENHADVLTDRNLESLSDYILTALDKKERRERKILTDNRSSTVNKRETSMEGLVSKFETGADGVYQIMREDKNMILSPAVKITKKDIEEVPFIQQIRESIEALKAIKVKNYIVQAAIIDLAQTQYIVKNAYRKPIVSSAYPSFTHVNVEWAERVDFKDWNHIAALLKNYDRLKTDMSDRVESDMYWILIDLERLIAHTIEDDYEVYYNIIVNRLEGATNEEIQNELLRVYGKTYSTEYISLLFNKKIPKLIASKAEELELEWHFTHKEKGDWKKCNRCGQFKLRNHIFFSFNKSSKDRFYSICKKCRNKKKGS